MQTINTNETGIHCKLSCNDQFRRFLFVGTEFSSLFSHVQQLLSLNNEFVLKYKDNEGDLITISTNEELACALNYSEGGILRLTASLPTDRPQQTTGPESSNVEYPGFNFHGRRGGKCGRGRFGGHGRFAHDPDAPQRFSPEVFKSKLTYKRDMIQSHLAELAKGGELSPEQQHKQVMLQAKLRHIEFRLAKFEEGGCGRWEKRASKWEAKAEKHKHKHRDEYGNFNQKQEKPIVILSEETRAQIAGIKTQIQELKPRFKEVKYQLKAKKAAMKEIKAKGGNVEQLANEIAQLKEARKAHKNQIRPLKEQIHALKHSN